MDDFTERFKAWMDERGLTADSVAPLIGKEKGTIHNWRSNGVPTRESVRTHVAEFMDRYDAEISRKEAKPLQNLVMEFEDGEFGAIEQAALNHGSTVRAWAKDVLNGAATMDVEAFVAEFFPDAAWRVSTSESAPSIASFPVRLLRAAAGFPILADAEVVEHDRDLGDGRFLLELRGDSMEPRFRDRQWVVLREKTTLRRPVLKYGELYCFVHDGAATFKQWAKDDAGRKVLRSLNPEHPDISADEATEWIGWFDPKDNL